MVRPSMLLLPSVAADAAPGVVSGGVLSVDAEDLEEIGLRLVEAAQLELGDGSLVEHVGIARSSGQRRVEPRQGIAGAAQVGERLALEERQVGDERAVLASLE